MSRHATALASAAFALAAASAAATKSPRVGRARPALLLLNFPSETTCDRRLACNARSFRRVVSLQPYGPSRDSSLTVAVIRGGP